MSARSWLLVLAGATAVAWVQLAGTPSAARAWAAILLVPLPALMIVEGRKLGELETVPRPQAYASTIVSLWLLAFATIGITWLSGYGAAELGLIGGAAARTLVIAVALTAAGIGVLFAFRLAGVREPPIVGELMPQSPTERMLFVGVSVTAGICEEIIFRGFLIHVIHGATASMPLALLLSSGAFGVAHAYQRPAGALRAALLGLLLCLPLLIDGSIVPSILAHAAIDIISGLWLARYLLR